MSLYPSLEDMKVDHLMKAQNHIEPQCMASTAPSAPALEPSLADASLYPSLGDYMGLELTHHEITQNLPKYALMPVQNTVAIPDSNSGNLKNMIAPLSGQSLGLIRAQVTNGIREVILCKDEDGKLGLRVHSVNNGVFVCLVSQNSPAAFAGIRFGDQILSVNGESVAGYSMSQVHKLFRNKTTEEIRIAIRDRPLERTVTMHKDSMGNIGFQFKHGKIIALVKDSSAARNGLLTDHQILEINGKNVVGMKDKEITEETKNGEDIVTVTVIPSYVYDHMIKNMSSSLLKNFMDHSVPDF